MIARNKEEQEMTTQLTHDVDIVYSPDECKFYLQQFSFNDNHDTRTSQMFDSEAEAVWALRDDTVIWGEWK